MALDSTTIDLCLSVFPWAHFRRTKGAVKKSTHLAGPARQYPHVYPCLTGHTARRQGARYLAAGTRRLSISWTAPTSTSSDCTGSRWPRPASLSGPNPISSLPAATPGRWTRPPGCVADQTGVLNRTTHRTALSRHPASHPLSRCKHRQKTGVSHQQLYLAGRHHRRLVSLPVAGRIVLQMDQTTPAHQVILRYLRERSEDTGLDSRLRVRAGCDHQEAPELRPESLHNSTDFKA